MFAQDPPVVTTSFSGLGTGEAAAVHMHQRALQVLRSEHVMQVDRDDVLEPRVLCYSATDNDKLPQKVLMLHKEASRPQHLFPDVLCRVNPTLRTTLKDIEQQYMDQCEFLHLECQSGAMTKKELKEEKTLNGNNFCREVSALLNETEFESHGQCLACQNICPISPTFHASLRERTWIEIAGTTCCPFSPMQRDHDGWLSASTVPCLVWAFSLRYYSPTVILHECVQAFTPETLLASLNMDVNAAVEVPRCPFSGVPSGQCFELDEWCMQSDVWTPTEFGIPTSGCRRYTRLGGGGVAFLDVSAEEVWGEEECLATLDVYLNLRDPDEDRLWERAHTNKQNANQTSRGTSHLLGSGTFARYEGHAIKVQNANFMVDDDGVLSTTTRVVVNLKHNAKFDTSIYSDHHPRLLKGSMFWDFTEDMTLQSLHKWLCQGFPHPSPYVGLSPDITHFFPFSLEVVSSVGQAQPSPQQSSSSSSVSSAKRRRITAPMDQDLFSLSEGQSSHLLGNSMHYALASFGFLLAAVTSDKESYRGWI